MERADYPADCPPYHSAVSVPWFGLTGNVM